VAALIALEEVGRGGRWDGIEPICVRAILGATALQRGGAKPRCGLISQGSGHVAKGRTCSLGNLICVGGGAVRATDERWRRTVRERGTRIHACA